MCTTFFPLPSTAIAAGFAVCVLIPSGTPAQIRPAGPSHAMSDPQPIAAETAHLPAPSFHIQMPPPGRLFHAVFPGSESGDEDSVSQSDLASYEQAVHKRAAWVCFSNEWFRSRAFPVRTATWIRQGGMIPYIRLMLRSDADLRHAEPLFTLARIGNGEFDGDLRAWAREARAFAYPLIVEYGTEANGDWFSWNGTWNPGGPHSFRDAYRHIIQVMREEGARNITWVFHVNAGDEPDAAWNRFEAYYPGPRWIDWIAVSAYGAQTPMEKGWPEFKDVMDAVYPRLLRLACGKPIVIAELGVTAGHQGGDQAAWADRALSEIASSRWPQVIAFSWWNSAWPNDGDRNHDSDMRVQDNPGLRQVFRNRVGADPRILDRSVWKETGDQPAEDSAGTSVRRRTP